MHASKVVRPAVAVKPLALAHVQAITQGNAFVRSRRQESVVVLIIVAMLYVVLSVTGKMIMLDYCSNQGVILEAQTTYSTTPDLAVVPSSSRITSVDNDIASEPPILHSHETSISPPSPSTSSTTSRSNSPSPQIIVGSTLGAFFGILIFSLISFFFWHRKRARKNKTSKQNELTPYMDVEDQHWDFLGKENRRLSKPFDILVEVCEFKSNQLPDWARAQKKTLAIDTQCQNANYISPHLVKILDLSPEYLESPFELTGVGEETMSVDQKVQLIFRKARTYQNDDKKYQPVTSSF
ncbi:hypothetical protein HYALB_00005098 [Hymenoscyphus albidus]|uniref:Uncharacterized protein n=1 Tax=Hymenoscyphus albidus TaxID=595503 RepID=A0A9N9Q0B2_9HELO|nr:hypothetical protein HYALB_00005098 [Hymenoscyphus albidus]